MIFHWLFIISTLILCAVAAMPTRAWLALADKFRNSTTRQKQRRFEAALAAQTQAFTPEQSFLPRGAGLALDHKRGLVFLAEPDGAQMRAAILPVSALGAHAARTLADNGFQEYVLEVEAPGTAHPSWRLRCADSDLAQEMDGALSNAANI